MRRFAIIAAVIAFFGLAIVGSLSNVPPFTCALRAGVGAVVIFVLARIFTRVFIGVMVNTVVSNSFANEESKGSRQ